jgi:hypothetical protein
MVAPSIDSPVEVCTQDLRIRPPAKGRGLPKKQAGRPRSETPTGVSRLTQPPCRPVKVSPLPVPKAQRERVREALIDRLEDATSDGRLDLSDCTFAILLYVLFPEDFRDPPAPIRASVAHPSNPIRVVEMEVRVATGKAVRHPADAPGDSDRRGVRPNWRSRLLVQGGDWQDEAGTDPLFSDAD